MPSLKPISEEQRASAYLPFAKDFEGWLRALESASRPRPNSHEARVLADALHMMNHWQSRIATLIKSGDDNDSK